MSAETYKKQMKFFRESAVEVPISDGQGDERRQQVFAALWALDLLAGGSGSICPVLLWRSPSQQTAPMYWLYQLLMAEQQDHEE